jgi:hypothetical protein
MDRRLAQIAAREQETILETLSAEEYLCFLGHSEQSSGGVDSDAAVVVTNRRLLVVYKNRIRRDIDHRRLIRAGMPYETRLHKHSCALLAEHPPEGFIVYIEDFDRARAFLASLGFTPG